MGYERLKKPVAPVQREPDKVKNQVATKVKTPVIAQTPEQLQRARAKLEQDRVQIQGQAEQASLQRESQAKLQEEARVQREAAQAVEAANNAQIQRALEVQAKQQAFFSSFIHTPTQRSALKSLKNSSVQASAARDSYQAAIVPEIVQRLVNDQMTATIQAARAMQQPNALTARADWFNTELPVLRAKHNHPNTPFSDTSSVFKPTDQQAFGLGNTYKLQRLSSGLTPKHAASAILGIQRKADRDIALQGLLTGVNPRQSDYSSIQRLVADGEHDLELQRQALLEGDEIQRQAFQLAKEEAHPTTPKSGISEKIKAKVGGGSPLPENVRSQLEAGLNTNLEAVRVHTDGEADKLAKSVNAIAFTTGNDIFFSSGSYNPNTKTGYELIAHEVTHTVQQASGQVSPGIDKDSSLETAAQSKGAELAAKFDPNAKISPSSNSSLPNLTSTVKTVGVQRFRATHASARAIQRKTNQDTQETPVGKRAFVRENGLHLRAQPDQKSEDLGTFEFGTRVFVVAQTGQWYKVITPSGKTGYMFSPQIHGLQPEHQAMLEKDPGLRLFRVTDGETGMGLVQRAYGITGSEGSKDQNLWHFLNVIRKNNQASAFGFKDKGFGDSVQNFFIAGADANNVMLKAKTDLWIPSFTIAAKDNSVGSGTVRGEITRLGKNIEQKIKDFQAAQTYAKAAMSPVFAKRLGEGAHELIEGLVIAMIAAAGVLVASTAIGAIVGAFAGGVGAAPGAALGFEIGTWVLEWLGLGFLVVWGVGKLTQVFGALGTFVSKVWNANGDQKQLQEAGVALADALAILSVSALQILVTMGIAKGLGAVMKGLANSRFGKMIGIPKLTAYLKGKLEGIGNTAGSTPKTAKIQEGLQSATPKAVLEKVTGTKPPKGFKSTPQELEALKAGKETVEVYTVGEIPKAGAQRWLALEEPKNWTSARQALHNELLSKAKLQSKAFAEAAKGEAPTIYAMRGNTAAGKSRAVKGNIPELETPVNATPNMPHRAVNPDNFKADLYKAQPEVSLTSTQVHSESSTLASMLQKELVNMKTSDGKMGSMLIDKRLASVADVQDYAALAKATGRKFNLYDVDAPLEVSLAGVLERKPGGIDPIPDFNIVGGGFTAVRSNRLQVIEFFEKNPTIGKYELFATTPQGAKVRVAVVENGKLRIEPSTKDLYIEVIADPVKLADLVAKKTITENLIAELTAQLSSERAKTVRDVLTPYIGKTWEQAMKIHSLEKPKP
jgi:Domain of unknown function (DUF4157)/Bacterial SH3 domain/Zeta toxin